MERGVPGRDSAVHGRAVPSFSKGPLHPTAVFLSSPIYSSLLGLEAQSTACVPQEHCRMLSHLLQTEDVAAAPSEGRIEVPGHSQLNDSSIGCRDGSGAVQLQLSPLPAPALPILLFSFRSSPITERLHPEAAHQAFMHAAA